MKRLLIAIAVVATVSWAWAQFPQYVGGGGTVAGSAATGMANAISAKGDYNLSTSAAAINLTQAQSQEIANRQQYTNTYFEMRETNRNARAAERGPRLTVEQLAQMAHESAPKPLSPGEANGVNGKLNWPTALQDDAFAADRGKVEALYLSYTELGNLGNTDNSQARKMINDMAKKLKAQIRTIPSTDYTTSKSFLRGLMFTMCKCQIG